MRKKLPLHMIRQKNVLIRLMPSVIFFFIFLYASSAQAQAVLLTDTDNSEELSYNEYSDLRNGNGKLYFITEGKKLWVSTGEEDSTENPQLLKDFSKASNLIPIGNVIYFVAEDGVSGAELWMSNGTEAGTILVKDLNVGSNGSNPEQLTNVNGILYFVANDGSHGKELWKSNGTAGGTVLVMDIFAKGGSSNPTSMVNVNG